MKVLDSFEQDSLSEYSGDTGKFSIRQDAIDGIIARYYGDNAFVCTSGSLSVVTRTDTTIEPSHSPMSVYIYPSGSSNKRGGLLFGVQENSGIDSLSGYATFIDTSGSIEIKVYDNGSVVNSASTSYIHNDKRFYELIISEWDSTGSITVELRDTSTTNTTASVSLTDDRYSAGGYGIAAEGDNTYFDYIRANIPPQPGETRTYRSPDIRELEGVANPGKKRIENISNIDQIIIDKIDGAEGGGRELSLAESRNDGGRGGLIENAVADVSNLDELEIWVGEYKPYRIPTDLNVDLRAFGRSKSGHITSEAGDSIAGGGSTEVWADGESTFIAAADGGGGSGFFTFGGGGGGAGGEGGLGINGAPDGVDAELIDCNGIRKQCSGGDGGGIDPADGLYPPTGGGQELGIASGGTLTTGGASPGGGEIKITYESSSTTSENPPEAPSNLSVELG